MCAWKRRRCCWSVLPSMTHFCGHCSTLVNTGHRLEEQSHFGLLRFRVGETWRQKWRWGFWGGRVWSGDVISCLNVLSYFHFGVLWFINTMLRVWTAASLSSAGAHPAQTSGLLPRRPISRARRVAGRRAGVGGEMCRPLAVARLQGRHGTG